MAPRWCSLRLTLHASCLLLLLLRPTPCRAYPTFTVPAANATVSVGELTVKWTDSSAAPLIPQLTSYTLKLMVGGNKAGTNDTNMEVLQTFVSDGDFSTGNSAVGEVLSSIAEELDNGFFFQLISTTDIDTQVINYSDRFSITGLVGSTDAEYVDAVLALDGSDAGPAAVLGSFASSTSSSVAATSTATATSSTSTTASETTSTASATTTAAAARAPSSNLSPGVSAAIGFVCGAVGLLLITLAALFIRRSRRRRRRQSPRSASSETIIVKPELPTNAPGHQYATQIGMREMFEADEGTPASELDTLNVKYELMGDIPEPAEADRGRLSVSSDAFSSDCGRLSSRYSAETLSPQTPRTPGV